jgi:hypothetical protein
LVKRPNAAARASAKHTFHALIARAGGAPLTQRRRGRGRGVAFFCAGLVGAIVAIVLLGVGAIALWLSQGPIDLASFGPRIASALDERFGHRYAFTLGPTALEHTDQGLAVSFQGVVIKDAKGRTLIDAPRGAVGLDLASLAMLDVRPKRLDLSGVTLRLRILPDGTLTVAEEGLADQPLALPTPPPAAAINTPLGPARIARLTADFIDQITGQQQSIDNLEIERGRLIVEDAVSHKIDTFEDLDFAFGKTDGAADMRVSARGVDGPWSISARAVSDGSRLLHVEAHDVSLNDALTLLGSRSRPFELSMPISTKFDVAVGPDKQLDSMTGHYDLGAGYFKLDDPDHKPFLVDEASGDWRWDKDRQRVAFENLELFAGKTHFNFTGGVSAPGGAGQAWALDLKASDGVVAGERPGEAPIRLDAVSLKARFAPDDKRFTLDELKIDGADVNGVVTGESVGTDQGPTLKIDMKVGRGPVTNLIRMWPSFIAADVRAWCLQNIHGGEALSGAMTVDWDAAAYAVARAKQQVPRDSVHGEFTGKDMVVDVLPGLPPMSGLDVSGSLTGHDIALQAKRGYIETAPGRRVQISNVAFSVPDTKPLPLVAAVGGARVTGGMDALADLASREALKPYVAISLDPSTTKGQFDGTLSLDLKLGKIARPQDQSARAEATLTNLSVDKVFGKERFEQGTLTLSIDRNALKITGEGKLFGTPATVDIEKGATDDGVMKASFTVDDAMRARRGLAGAGLTGPMVVKLKAPMSKADADVDIDLTRVAIDNPLPGFAKAAGKPGHATFTVKPDGDGVLVDNLTVEAGGAQIKGSAQLSGDLALVSAKIASLKLSPGDDLKADLTASDQVVKLVVRGNSYDARPVIKSTASTTGSSGKDLDLDFKVASVIGGNHQTLSGVELSAARRGGQFQQLNLTGKLGGGELAAHSEGAGVVRVQSTDAGGVLSFFDLYSHMVGGTLDVAMRIEGERKTGQILVKKFVLRNEPALRKLVSASASSSPAAAEGARRVDPDSAPFQRMTARFSEAGDRIDITNAVISDQQMGLTTEGYIDFVHDAVDLSGTFVPAYQVNNLVSHIPVVGMLLGGGADEGMFAINYRISGPASAPTLTVNPLSAMAPGFLRKIFGVLDGTGRPIDSAAAPPPQTNTLSR